MKIPRDISGQELIKQLKIYGYVVTRQSDNYIRLSTDYEGQHHITIPNHNPLKIGMLSTHFLDKLPGTKFKKALKEALYFLVSTL